MKENLPHWEELETLWNYEFTVKQWVCYWLMWWWVIQTKLLKLQQRSGQIILKFKCPICYSSSWPQVKLDLLNILKSQSFCWNTLITANKKDFLFHAKCMGAKVVENVNKIVYFLILIKFIVQFHSALFRYSYMSYQVKSFCVSASVCVCECVFHSVFSTPVRIPYLSSKHFTWKHGIMHKKQLNYISLLSIVV